MSFHPPGGVCRAYQRSARARPPAPARWRSSTSRASWTSSLAEDPDVRGTGSVICGRRPWLRAALTEAPGPVRGPRLAAHGSSVTRWRHLSARVGATRRTRRNVLKVANPSSQDGTSRRATGSRGPAASALPRARSHGRPRAPFLHLTACRGRHEPACRALALDLGPVDCDYQTCSDAIGTFR